MNLVARSLRAQIEALPIFPQDAYRDVGNGSYTRNKSMICISRDDVLALLDAEAPDATLRDQVDKLIWWAQANAERLDKETQGQSKVPTWLNIMLERLGAEQVVLTDSDLSEAPPALDATILTGLAHKYFPEAPDRAARALALAKEVWAASDTARSHAEQQLAKHRHDTETLIDQWNAVSATTCQEVEAAEAHSARLAAYVQHKPECNIVALRWTTCTCGLDALLPSAAETETR